MQINSELVKENAELRAAARSQLKGKWGTAVLLCLIYAVISGGLSYIPYIGSVASLIIAGPLSLGLVACFLKLVREEPFRFENLFDGFSNFKSSFLTFILMSLFIFLWSLLLVIPGIIATYRYAMAFYILYDNPGISAKDALNASKEMMKGYKGKLFLLHLSFLGWALLCILTVGIGYLWLVPYFNAAQANFYQNLKDASVEDAVPAE